MNDDLFADDIVRIRGLSRHFGAKAALVDVDLTLPTGTVLGLVGRNGAGKTTLIRHVLGLLKAQEGSVRVFGRDPASDPVGVLSRIGYLSEEADLPSWMRVGELMRYSRAFYPSWDEEYAEQLREEFELYESAADEGAPRWRLWMEVSRLLIREFELRYGSLREDHGEMLMK